MSSSIYIVSAGARTPLGMEAPTSAAAVRAGIMGLAAHPFMIDQAGDAMPAALDSQLDPALFGAPRLLALAETAVREACAPLASVKTSRLRLPVFLGLPAIRPGFTQQDAAAVRSGLTRLQGLPADLLEAKIFTEGHAAGISALAAAASHMVQGASDACLVGGVESYFHPDTMEWLDSNRQMAGSVARAGFIPGEGAGFCLLMTDQARARFGFKALTTVRSQSVGRETKLIKTQDMCLGEGLAGTVAGVLAGLTFPQERINAVLCDINGERYRSEEWGFVCLRLGEYFDDVAGYSSPAECWGDMGAASGPLFAMLVFEAAARGRLKAARTLVWASSEGGQRGAAVLEACGKI